MNRYPCVGCKKDESEEAFKAADVKAYTKKPHSKKLLCLECDAQGRTISDAELNTCRLCNKAFGRARGSTKDMNNLQQGKL